MLGSVGLLHEAEPTPVGPSGRLLLAALLARRRDVVSEDELAEALWGQHPPPTARATLQTHLSKLRQRIGSDPDVELAHRAPGYVLDVGPTLVDADRFEERLRHGRSLISHDPEAATRVLGEALALWRGGAFAEFADTDWARPEAVRLDELRLVALEARVDARLAAGDPTGVVGELEGLTRDHPLRERFWAQLVLALMRSGRQGDALRRAHELRTTLDEELGLEPSRAFRDLEQAVATDDPSLLDAAPVHPAPARGPAESARTEAVRIPMATTALLGRDGELADLAELVARNRLVTLTGTGGVGKSHLATELARRSAAAGRIVRLVELAAVADASAVPVAVAAGLDVERRQGRTLEESIVDVLAQRELLLVLDNCEHVIASTAPLVGEVLRWCPGLRILATSREPLGVPGERVWSVHPLRLPDDIDGSVAEVGASPAVQLFVSRASDAAHDFTFDEHTCRAVAELCTELDGLPLALQLAAARMGSMSPRQLTDRLNERFDLLDRGPASEPRHRTLHDVVQWSYELLTDEQRELLARLSVFSGGFELDAVERTCADSALDPSRIVAVLVGLVEKSLVIADSHEGRVRYRQLETIRQFASARLAESPDAERFRQAHVHTFVAVAEDCAESLDNRHEKHAVDVLDRELANLRAAMGTAVEIDDADSGLRIAAATSEYAFRRIRYEVVAWAEAASELASARDHPLLPVNVAIAGYGCFVRGEVRRAVELAERSLGAGVRLGLESTGLAERVLGNALFYGDDPQAATVWVDRLVACAVRGGGDGRIAHGLYMQSVAQTSQGRSDRGAALADEALVAAHRCGSPTALAHAHYAAGLAVAGSGSETGAAIAHLEEAAELARSVGNRWLHAFAMTEAMTLRASQGEVEIAMRGFREVVETWYRGGDWANQWLSLRQLVGLLAAVGDDEKAVLLSGAVTAAGATAALPIAPPDIDDLRTALDGVERHLGRDRVEELERRGSAMTDEAVVAFALAALDELV